MTEQDVRNEVARLRTLSHMELKEEYERTFGKPAGLLGEVFLRRRIAMRHQERMFGGLTSGEKALLDRLAKKDPHVNVKARGGTGMMPIRGVTYCRVYKGRLYEAKAVGYNQYEMDGKIYPSLTACVKAATGFHQSGKKWFHLKGSL